MSIFETKQRAAEVPQPTGGMSFSLARLLNQEAYDTDPIKTDGDALKSYSGWIYACVSTISQDVRSSSWSIWQRAGNSRKDWKKLEGSQIPDILLRPSATQTWGDLIEVSQTHLDLAGRAFWHLVTAPGSSGRVIGIQPLNPDWINKAVYNTDKTMLTGWEINVSGSTRRVLPAEDVILFRYPDPVDPTGGISPVRAVAMSVDMDTYSRAYAASHLRNHAQPTGILTTEAELTRDQAALLAEGWQDSHQGTSKIQVLGKGAQFQSLSAHIKDLEFLNLARVSRDQILAAYHIPASRIGLIEDSSRANGEEADRVYSALCLGPRLKRYEEPITHKLFPRIGLDPTRYSFEFDPVDVADKEFERISAETAFGKGAITMDEYRERIGFEPEAGGNGAVFFVPMGSTVTENPETGMAPMSVSGPSPAFEDVPTIAPDDAARGEAKVGESIAPETVLNGAQVTSLIQVVTAMMTGSLPYASALEIIQSAFGMSMEKALRILGPESNAGINKPEETAAAVDRALESIEIEVDIEADDRELEDPSDEQIEITALRFLNSQGDGERRMKGRLRAVFTKMSKAVVAAVKGERAKGKIVEVRASEVALDAVIDGFNEEMARIIEEEAINQFAAGHEAFASEIAAKVAPELLIEFDLISDSVMEWARKHSAKEITKISDTTKLKVRRVLGESLEANESIDQLAKRLREDFNKFKGVRAETIARTETAGSYNAGKFNNSQVFADENPTLDVLKTWVPTQDERTREHHKAKNIKNQTGENRRTVLQNEPFLVNDERMMRPLDPEGSAENVVRCRCVLIYDVKGV